MMTVFYDSRVLARQCVIIAWFFVNMELDHIQRRVAATTLTAFSRIVSEVPLRSAISRDARYGPWPNATQILYRLDTGYTVAEQTTIQQAMAQISSDMSGCLKFSPYVSGVSTGSDYIFIGKTVNNGQPISTCFTFPGHIVGQAGQGQKMVVFGANTGSNGCLETQRDVMKYFVHVLGVRNEFNRPDRDQFIQVFPGNVRPELRSLNIFKLYTAAQVDYLNTAFDYNSVTIPSPTKYAIPGSVLFTPTTSGRSFGTLPRLSQGDCVGLALQYSGCSSASCQDPYGTSTATTSLFSANTVVTTTSTRGPIEPNVISPTVAPSFFPFV